MFCKVYDSVSAFTDGRNKLQQLISIFQENNFCVVYACSSYVWAEANSELRYALETCFTFILYGILRVLQFEARLSFSGLDL